ncbi:MAG: PilZ domain-containing protein [Deltaproteobacteria bacterium]|nr:PilZ domain-containing protein [Deltaproteobacteria bacterium]
MYRLECPGCGEWLHAPLINGTEMTRCPVCADYVPYREVYVAAGPFSIKRDVLIRNSAKYRALLFDAQAELERLRSNEAFNPFGLSAAALEDNIGNLKELLEGAAGTSAASANDVRFSSEDADFSGRLVNVSLNGISLDARGLAGIKEKDTLTVDLISVRTPFLKVMGEAAWVEVGRMGIKFIKDDREARKGIADYISARGRF